MLIMHCFLECFYSVLQKSSPLRITVIFLLNQSNAKILFQLNINVMNILIFIINIKYESHSSSSKLLLFELFSLICYLCRFVL